MSSKKYSVLSLITGLLLVSQGSHAEAPWTNPDWADWSNSAWYAGAGVGRSAATIDQDRITASLIENGASSVMFNSSEHDTAYKLMLGKQMNQYFAIEGGYFDLGKFSFNATTIPAGTLNGTANFRGLNVDVIGFLPITERFSVFGLIGANYARANVHFTGNRLNAVTNPNPTETKLNPKFGLGLEYKLTEALSLRGEVERYRVNDAVNNRGDVNFYSINLIYKFGQPTSRPAPPMARVEPPVNVPPAAIVRTVPPPPPPPTPTSEKVTFSAETLFDFDKSIVKQEGKVALIDLLKKLEGMDTEVMVTVGHTDSIGTEEYNQKLSMRRAEAVKSYLVLSGVDASRIYTEGKGKTQPIADNKTSEGRAQNRRVTVEVIGSRKQ
ncbi:OmpA family protein [Undibacterium sp. RuRC25W]|uniref:OmpA family protein n=1 Tax=Undibacterium sp. RuRC25W TaxID=3413047 RepID=UPI003BF42D00